MKSQQRCPQTTPKLSYLLVVSCVFRTCRNRKWDIVVFGAVSLHIWSICQATTAPERTCHLHEVDAFAHCRWTNPSLLLHITKTLLELLEDVFFTMAKDYRFPIHNHANKAKHIIDVSLYRTQRDEIVIDLLVSLWVKRQTSVLPKMSIHPTPLCFHRTGLFRINLCSSLLLAH